MNPSDQLEVLQPSALESLERAQIDVQVATAHRFPRSLEQFKKRALDMVQQDLETAESCIYSRPVGKGDDGKQKYAEGASIRMAEIVAACYGNIRFGARIIEQTERFVKAEGVCHDLESNSAGKSEAMESTVKRNGQPYDERMRIVVAKACLSKALRDAIFRVVPRALCKSIIDAATATINKQARPIAERVELVKKWMGQISVHESRVFAVLNVKGWSEVGNEQLLVLTGLKTAIRDNEITIEEAFPKLTDAQTGQTGAPTPTPTPQGKTATPTPTPQPQTGTPTPPVAQQQPAGGSDLGPQCKYCKQPVENMADHSCPQMEEAMAKTATTTSTANAAAASTPTADPVPSEGDAEESIKLLCTQSGIKLETVMAWAKANKLAKPDQNSISQLATTKLASIGKQWPKILPELQKLQGVETPAQ